MHYRVAVYNYLHRRFAQSGVELVVRASSLQPENENRIDFDLAEIPFKFSLYRDEINRLKPQAVILFLHIKDPITLPLVHWLRLKGIPSIYWTHGGNLSDPGNRLSAMMHRYMHQVCNRVLLYSEDQMGLVRRGLHHKVFVANNTLNFEEFPEITGSPEEIKQDLGIPFKKVVLAVGRMEIGGGRKKIDRLVDIFGTMEGTEHGLVVVGSGVSQEIRARMNPENTIFMGPVHDPETINRVFFASDVFCLPGFMGLGLNQAFHWGLPVVTEAGVHPPEFGYLEDGVNGYVVPENDVEALKGRLVSLLENDETRKRMSENAKQVSREEASMERMFSGFDKCVRSLGITGRNEPAAS
jgi:glycosyltransferase involved in cell wall biosynthesis